MSLNELAERQAAHKYRQNATEEQVSELAAEVANFCAENFPNDSISFGIAVDPISVVRTENFQYWTTKQGVTVSNKYFND